MKKKAIIIGILAVVILAVALLGTSYAAGKQKDTAMQTVSLAKTDLADSVLVSGTVTSSNTMKVYSKVNAYSIKEVYVEAGDKVKAGDLLAQLDTSALELDIKQTELNIKNAEATLANETSSNQSGIQNANNSLKTARIELENAKRNYDKIKQLADAGASTADELRQAESAWEKAQISYDNARIALENSQNKNISAARNNLEIQRVMLEKQKKTLNDTRITAPMDGTVTMVNAKAGETASGILFVVEDTENLIVSTAIGEYDIGLIKPGQEVTVKTDSTGDRQFAGTVTKIAPSALKDAAGDTASSSTVQFDTEIALKNTDSAIKIGMTARLTIKLSEKQNVYAVPYDAVIEENDGSKWIYVLEQSGENGKTGNVTKKVRVETGMDTDMYVEISGADLKDGMQVLVNPKAGNAASREENS